MARKTTDSIEPSLDYSQLFSIQPNLTPTGLLPLDTVLGGGFEPGDMIAITSEPGVGKALSMDATLYTETGPIQMKDVKVGDRIADPDGNFVEVVGVYPQGVKKMYKVEFDDGTVVRCSHDHLWTVTKDCDRRKRIHKEYTLTTEEMAKSVIVSGTSRTAKNYAIRRTTPVKFKKNSFAIHPYVLGVLLGDGAISVNSVRIHNPEKDIHDKIEGLIREGDHISDRVDERSNCPRYSICGISKEIKRLGLTSKRSWEKFIPTEYKYSDVDDRLEVLRGLLDADAHVSYNNSIEFSTTSEMLANDVKEIVCSLGGRASICSRMGAYRKNGVVKKTKLNYRLVITFANGVVPVSSNKHLSRWSLDANLQRKHTYISSIEEIEPEECQCIRVDNESHLFLTNGFIPTHNTTLFLTLAKNFIEKGERVAYFDIEKGVKMGILKNFGIDEVTGCDIKNSLFFLIKPDTYVTMEKAFKDCVKFGFKYIFIDSMSALIDSNCTEELVTERVTIGETARIETKLYPVLKALAKVNGVTLFIVQQTRVKSENKGLRVTFGKDSSGGYAAKHTPDVRLFLDKGPKYVEERTGLGGDTEKVEYGNEARLWAEKNRNAPPFIKVPCPIVYGRGMKNTFYVDLILRARGVIKSSGPYYKITLNEGDEPITIQGKVKLSLWINDNLDTCIDLIKKNGWSEIQAVEVQ